MTAHDDLATLRRALAFDSSHAPAALDRVEAEIARLQGRVYALETSLPENYMETLRAAEADNARLRDGLRRIAEGRWNQGSGQYLGGAPDVVTSVRYFARALLADQDGAA